MKTKTIRMKELRIKERLHNSGTRGQELERSGEGA
jgi:hypothetical protein